MAACQKWFPGFFVACAHHKAARLIVTPQLGGFACRQRFTVDDDPVTRTHILGGLMMVAINTDTAIGNPCLSCGANRSGLAMRLAMRSLAADLSNEKF